jgi:hypothetical protein
VLIEAAVRHSLAQARERVRRRCDEVADAASLTRSLLMFLWGEFARKVRTVAAGLYNAGVNDEAAR